MSSAVGPSEAVASAVWRSARSAREEWSFVDDSGSDDVAAREFVVVSEVVEASGVPRPGADVGVGVGVGVGVPGWRVGLRRGVSGFVISS